MGEASTDLSSLLDACKELDALPTPWTDTPSRAFFSNFSLERLFRALAGAGHKDDVALVSDVLGKLLRTDLGRSILPDALPYLEAAAAAPLPPLRRLAAEQYGNLLLAHTVRQAPDAAADGGAEDGGGGVAAACCRQLVRALTGDADAGVAAAASAALRSYGTSGPAALRTLLAPGSAVAAALAAAAAADAGGTVRLRVLGLALELAAGGAGAATHGSANGHMPHSGLGPGASAAELDERLALLRGSGLLDSLLSQLADPRDALASLAALQLLEDLLAAADGGGGAGSGLAAALAGVALPQLLTLVAEPTLTEAAMPLVAGIVRRCMPEALPPAALAAAVGSLANGGAAMEAANGPTPMDHDGAPAAAPPVAVGGGLPAALRAAPALLAAAAAEAGPGSAEATRSDAADAPYHSTLAAPALVERVRAAVMAGPYGSGGGGAVDAAEAARMHQQHFLATRGGGGGA
ncbi:hypothetical protein GPECTOR_46g237 [Gonium pectorale]|uniref:Uncharacterized protein n=1 Tax=Gonium pectorale TaxID=33097 RepID=A0A150G8L9_GONPE|nr:hypothetical protein GPECTOR_46g237 [Gonium pectorale]|eukprot:KXZ46168.1 hypothetical protein GPECTOR_46g237 [Gonium pectorale]